MVRSPEPRADGEEGLPDIFWAVARQLREMSQESLAPWDITPAQLRALRVLRRHGPVRLSELSEHLGIAARSATEVTDALQGRGLAARRPDPGDRRATLVETTQAGTGLLHEVRAARGSEAGRVFDRLSPAEQAELARLLVRLLPGPAEGREPPAQAQGDR